MTTPDHSFLTLESESDLAVLLGKAVLNSIGHNLARHQDQVVKSGSGYEIGREVLHQASRCRGCPGIVWKPVLHDMSMPWAG